MNVKQLGVVAVSATALLGTWTPTSAADVVSDDCPVAGRIVEGFLGNAFVSARVDNSLSPFKPSTICFRVAVGGTDRGGKLTLGGPLTRPVSTDTDTTACTTTPGNLVPPPYGVSVGTAAVTVYVGNGQAWICAGVNTTRLRFIFDTGSRPNPVTLATDSPAAPPAVPAFGAAARPSSACQADDGETGRLVNLYLLGSHTFLYRSTQAGVDSLCVRSDGPDVGAKINIDRGAAGPVAQPGFVWSPACIVEIIGISGVLHVYRSNVGSTVTVCVTGIVPTVTLTAGTAGSGNPITLEMDP